MRSFLQKFSDKYLSKYSPFPISCIPNAGLPENIGGKAHYRLTPIELKMQILNFVEDLGVRIIGGCCGTTPSHIREHMLTGEPVKVFYYVLDDKNIVNHIEDYEE